MAQPLNVLIAEDNPNDAELMLRELSRSGFEPVWRRVETEADFLAGLTADCDIVLSDYQMPRFTGLRAMELLTQSGLEIPFILVSGTIGEDAAVEAMRMGVTDYLLKDRLMRLGNAVKRALSEYGMLKERRRAEAALRVSEERFRQLAENIHEVFWMADAHKGDILYVSPAYEKIWGRPCQGLYDSPKAWLETIHAEDRERIRHAAATKQWAGTYDEEYRIMRPDGTQRWIRDRAFAVRSPDGALQRFVGVAEDITDSKKLQEQFLRAQRMEAVGTLAGGIAHDLNNILAPVLMAPALLRETFRSAHERQLLDLIEQGARRGANIVRQLLTFSRGTGGERVGVQMRHQIKEMADLMKETFPRDITIEHHAAKDLRPMEGDPTQLHQVLMNLCVNARDAMPGGGSLVLTARNEDLDADAVRDHPPARPGPYVVVHVADTGSGIAPENLGRIFDPFFTTKPPSKGTGLGLSTVLGIVRSHNGFITVETAPGKGTTFSIHLPAAQEPGRALPTMDLEAMPGGKGELILVVDDEASIRTALRLTLERHGYGVLLASEGAEALQLFLKYRDAIHVVFTDVMMPVMGGLTLISALRAADPNVKVIAMTGLNDQANDAALKAAGANCILSKPWSAPELLQALRAQISAPP